MNKRKLFYYASAGALYLCIAVGSLISADRSAKKAGENLIKLIDLKEREMQIRHESTMTQANTTTRIGENSLKYLEDSR